MSARRPGWTDRAERIVTLLAKIAGLLEMIREIIRP